MKILLVFLLVSASAVANTNLSDQIDQNEIPAELEEREEETLNKPDELDENNVPAALEERKKKEKWRKDYSEEQYDTKKKSQPK